MAANNLPEQDKEFLAKLEKLFKDRYTEKDEEFMKVHNLPPSTPPILENWNPPTISGHRNKIYNPNKSHNNRDYNNRYQDRRSGGHRNYSNYSRGYNDYEDRNDQHYRRSRY